MTQKIIHLIMAARPNIMKVAPLYHALKAEPWARPVLIHTGQHYDDAMSGAFMRGFGLPEPDYALSVGSGTYAEQAGRTMMGYEAVLKQSAPDLCVVIGDVNATIACAMTAKKAGFDVAHLEAGLRSFDRRMPEEINRLATDAISDWFWTPSADATAHLLREGVDAGKIMQVGNIMIDTLVAQQGAIAQDDTRHALGLDGRYAVATFHRPSNVDGAENLLGVVECLEGVAARLPVVFAVHPRTKSKLEAHGLMARVQGNARIIMQDPMAYVPFMNLVSGARVLVTDSGGVQEESTYLGVPCLTLRENTERPITLTHGTNQLVGFDTVLSKLDETLNAPAPTRPVIDGWDGHAAARITAHIKQILCV